jgi:hypothetical protein
LRKELKKGGITMRVSSLHTIEYLKLHLAYNGIKTGLVRSLHFAEKIIVKAAEQTTLVVAFLLPAFLVSVAIVRINEASLLTAYCSDVCEKILPIMLLIQ